MEKIVREEIRRYLQYDRNFSGELDESERRLVLEGKISGLEVGKDAAVRK